MAGKNNRSVGILKAADQIRGSAGRIVVIALAVLLAAAAAPRGLPNQALLAFGLTLLAMTGLAGVVTGRARAGRARAVRQVSPIFEHDRATVVLTDPDGLIHYRNATARGVGDGVAATLADLLSGQIAAPSALIRRLRQRAEAGGQATEFVAGPTGGQQVILQDMGGGSLLWRVEDRGRAATEEPRPGEHFSLPMMTVSKAGTVLYMNAAARELFGKRIAHLKHAIRDLPLRVGDIHEIPTPGGRQLARVHAISGSFGRQELYFLRADPTQLSRMRPWQALEHLPIPLVKLAADGTILASNRPARELLNFRDEAGHFSEIVQGLGRPITDWLGTALRADAPVQPEFVRATRAKGEKYLQVTLARLGDDDGTALLAMLNDATKLKTLEAQFVQSQKMQAIGQLAGGVAHDFNNLLTAISGHCDLLMLRRDHGDPDYADLEQIHQNANRAASLVGQLLAFSRKQTLKPEVIDVPQGLSDLAHLLNRLVGEKVELSVENAADLPPIRADRRQLEQVVMNLVVNARDAMPDGGAVRITTHTETLVQPMKRDEVSVPAGEYVVITVADQGVGIPPEQLGKIFEPFFTTKRAGEGTGLGLSMVYGIVKQTGGFIFADSVVGAGTTFTLFFPALEANQTVLTLTDPILPARMPEKSGGTILLVEDEEPVRAFASRALQMRGYKVLEADCAETALDLLGDKALNVDVFVTDVIMPGMDGPSWVAEALKDRPETSVVFMSGYAEESFGEQQARIPHSVFLPKPFSLSDLASTVSAQMH